MACVFDSNLTVGFISSPASISFISVLNLNILFYNTVVYMWPYSFTERERV